MAQLDEVRLEVIGMSNFWHSGGWTLAIFGPIVLIIFYSWFSDKLEKAKQYDEKKSESDRLARSVSQLKNEKEAMRKDVERLATQFEKEKDALKKEREALETLFKEKTKGFPWLADAHAEYQRLQDSKEVRYLQTKSHPAPAKADKLRQVSSERRKAEKAARVADHLLDYCRFLAPWLDDYIGIEAKELDQIIANIHSSWEVEEEEIDEEVKRKIGPTKWDTLTLGERLQRKLNWYWEKPNKSNWQIGRDYERYIGYLYEQKGWNVYYHGKKGFEDLGRDLICKKDKNVEVIQCKYWSKDKSIHEKHVYYLFGTVVEYYLENFAYEKDMIQLSLFPELVSKGNVRPKLVITTEVTPKAAQVAKLLGVDIQIIPFQRYPSIKCNVSRKDGEKIFHLPFDQQYDTILIEEERLERYVDTVYEAESLGFRHAYRWKGETPD
jgi:hypothetical protein